MKSLFSPGAALASLGLMLAACGGGGVKSTPMPDTPPPAPGGTPTPTPAPGTPAPIPTLPPTPAPGTPAPVPGGGGSYDTIADLVEKPQDYTFQTAGIRLVSAASVETLAFGNDLKIEYLALQGGLGTYRLTGRGGATSDFAIGLEVQLDPQTVRYDGLGNADTLILIVPKVGGVNLSYTMLGAWTHFGQDAYLYLAAGGVPTRAANMPKSGRATYSTLLTGSALSAGNIYSLNAYSSAAFSADFASGKVDLEMTLTGIAASSDFKDFGTVSGTGTIAGSNPGFQGALTGSGGVTGVYSGAFFGPAAAEMGMGWNVKGADYEARGMNAGRKN